MMMHTFKSAFLIESNRGYVKIPFNVCDVCGQKGLIPVEAEIAGVAFECRLVPKGNGNYYIPVTKEIYKKFDFSEELDVKFKVIRGLSRINSNSPYSKDNPIRKIDGITYLRQPWNGSCGQVCLAMIAGISVDEVMKVMKCAKTQVSISKVIETLDYFGFSHGAFVYAKGKKVQLPKCCIANVRGKEKSHLIVYHDGKYFDPAHGILDSYPYEDMISYMEINI